ncbi:hypothetical protein [Aquipuribacter nitratireducens]|uniref:Histidine kinase n=1 Tax=Aquipuribacter nitratireducens TaxID=650104 RepID=A0ABW0GT24_9MICO
MTATTAATGSRPLVSFRSVPIGVVGGLAGGIVFGLMMQLMGMLGMVGMLVGSESLAVAWVVHLLISAAIGAGFGLVLAPRVNGLATGLGLGAAYGLLWWALGPLLLMPAAMGMPVLTVDATAGQSLLGHLVFGLVLGVVVALARRRAGSPAHA